MPLRTAIALAFAAHLVHLPTLHAQVIIKVIRQDNGKPVEGADVRVREVPTQEAIGKAGTTDKDGEFKATDLPGKHTQVFVNVDANVDDLQPTSKIYQIPKDGKPITIVLPTRPPVGAKQK